MTRYWCQVLSWASGYHDEQRQTHIFLPCTAEKPEREKHITQHRRNKHRIATPISTRHQRYMVWKERRLRGLDPCGEMREVVAPCNLRSRVPALASRFTRWNLGWLFKKLVSQSSFPSTPLLHSQKEQTRSLWWPVRPEITKKTQSFGKHERNRSVIVKCPLLFETLFKIMSWVRYIHSQGVKTRGPVTHGGSKIMLSVLWLQQS